MDFDTNRKREKFCLIHPENEICSSCKDWSPELEVECSVTLESFQPQKLV